VYSINWLPIGGFVKLYGEDDAGGGSIKLTQSQRVKDEKRAFYARPVWQRALVVVAGVVMNTLLAIVIFYTYLGISGFKAELPLLGKHEFFGVTQTNKATVIVTDIAKNSPAAKAGIEKNAQIVSINGQKVDDTKQFLQIVSTHKGKPITLVWNDLKTGKQYTVKLIPRVNPPKNEGSLGVKFYATDVAVLNYATPTQKVFSGIVHPINLMAYNFDIMGKLFQVSVEKKSAEPLGEGVAGPIGIYSLVGNILQLPDMKEKILQVLNLAGILSISLAFFNVLPIPALDGGRLFFILVEGVTGRKVNQKVEGMIHTIGFIVLLGLILLITFQDIRRFILPFFFQ
jgi:regulator of sigma E protease